MPVTPSSTITAESKCMQNVQSQYLYYKSVYIYTHTYIYIYTYLFICLHIHMKGAGTQLTPSREGRGFSEFAWQGYEATEQVG